MSGDVLAALFVAALLSVGSITLLFAAAAVFVLTMFKTASAVLEDNEDEEDL